MSEPNANIFKAIDAESRGTSFQEVVSQLREMIHKGALRPGDRLPPERDLAKQLGVSRILTALMNMVATILFEVRSKTVKRARDLKESAEMHRTIYRAIRERNPAAARDAMRDHLMLAQKAGTRGRIPLKPQKGTKGNVWLSPRPR